MGKKLSGLDIDITVVHWRAPERCATTVRSLLDSEGVSLRIRVIDNEGLSAVALRAALPEQVEIEPEPMNLGYSGGANRGLELARSCSPRAEFIAVASHDVDVEPNTLAALASVLRSDQHLGICGPVLLGAAPMAGGAWRGWRAKPLGIDGVGTGVVERDWVSGSLMVIRRECLEAIGGFDERFGSYVEDVDLCLRARDAGWGVGVVGSARASTSGSISEKVTRYVDVNSVLLIAKRSGQRKAIVTVGRYLWWVPRGLVAAMAPGRSLARRRASLRHAWDHLLAIAELMGRWNEVRGMAKAGRTQPGASRKIPVIGHD